MNSNAKAMQLSDEDAKIIANKIKSDIFNPIKTYKTSIFLCGKDIADKSSIRYKISEYFSVYIEHKVEYTLIYPEEIFDEILYGTRAADLLSLENLLADSVDVVIIVPESPGSFAELGAFANSDRLRNKIICIIDKKYQRDKSFINKGPVKLIKGFNKEAVVYIDTEKIGISKFKSIKQYRAITSEPELDRIASAARKIKKNHLSKASKLTLLQLDQFLMPTIYILEPVTKVILTKIVEFALDDKTNANHSTLVAITSLTKKKLIEYTPDGYKLTSLGFKEYMEIKKAKVQRKSINNATELDNLRLEILNLKNRGKKLSVG